MAGQTARRKRERKGAISMRFDTPIYFQTVHAGAFDPSTGDYLEETVTEVKKYASVTCTEIKMLGIVYGTIQQGALTVRLQRPYKEPFDRIKIDSKLYKVDYEHPLKNKTVFVVSEVQHGKD